MERTLSVFCQQVWASLAINGQEACAGSVQRQSNALEHQTARRKFNKSNEERKMKLTLVAALATGLLSTAAMAQTVEFRGAACLTTVTASCPASGWDVGDCMLLR